MIATLVILVVILKKMMKETKRPNDLPCFSWAAKLSSLPVLAERDAKVSDE